jgi:hypothetical protein
MKMPPTTTLAEFSLNLERVGVRSLHFYLHPRGKK